jgi:hypothetical protein
MRAGPRVDDFADVRRRLVLDHAKWDPQVGDEETLARFPLLLRHDHWAQLARWTEALAAETAAAEAELLGRPDLHCRLGLPWGLRRALRRAVSPTGPRLIRFDFHWTAEGWRVSEANADVPGGLCEASAFPAMMVPRTTGATTAGDPAAAWADAVAAAADAADIALLTAPGFMEDHQVMAHLAGLLRDRGCRPHLAGPRNVAWDRGRPMLDPAFGVGSLGAVVRFVQAEWLPRWTGWRNYFGPTSVPVLNPTSAILAESKRFPLTWGALQTPVPTWRALLPETADPGAVPWRQSPDQWLLKTAYCNTGDTVSTPNWTSPRRWRSARRAARLRPGSWVAQRRFATVPVDTPLGSRYPCIGVFAVSGRAIGAYGRLSTGPVVDFAAVDVAVLVEPEGDRGEPRMIR